MLEQPPFATKRLSFQQKRRLHAKSFASGSYRSKILTTFAAAKPSAPQEPSLRPSPLQRKASIAQANELTNCLQLTNRLRLRLRFRFRLRLNSFRYRYRFR